MRVEIDLGIHESAGKLLRAVGWTALCELVGEVLAAEGTTAMTQAQEDTLLARITVNPEVFGGKPIIRDRRLAIEHVLGMLAAGDSIDDLLREYPWLERDDVHACLVCAKRLVGFTTA